MEATGGGHWLVVGVTALAAARIIGWIVFIAAALPALLLGRRVAGRVAAVRVLAIVLPAGLWALGVRGAGAMLVILVSATGLLWITPRRAVESLARRAWRRTVDGVREVSPAAVAIAGPARRDAPSTLGLALGYARRLPTAFRAGAGRVARRLEEPERRETAVVLTGAALFGVALAAWRALAETPLAPAEAHEILVREGWIVETGLDRTPIADLALSDAVRRITGEPNAVAALAASAAVVFVAAWFGLAASRRLVPGAPAWPLAAVAAVVPALEIVAGAPAVPSLVVGAEVAWGLAAGLQGASASWVWPAALTCFDPVLGVVGALVAADGVVSGARRRGEGRARALPRTPGARFATVVAIWGSVLFALVVTRLAMGVWPHPVAPVTALRAPVLRALSLGAVAVLLGVRRAGEERGALGARRVLALVTAAALVRDVVTPTPSTAALASSLGAIAAVTALALLPSSGLAAATMRARAFAATCLVAMAAMLVVWPRPRADATANDAMELAIAVRARHLRWQTTVIGPAELLPAFAGEVWFLDAAQATSRFDPSRYGEGPNRWRIDTARTYVVLRPSDQALAAWVDRLGRAGAPVEPVPELARGVFRVYALTRSER